MKIQLYILLFLLLFSCKKNEEIIAFKSPNAEITSVYSKGELQGEASINILNVTSELSEVGIVWSEKSGPTTADSKQSFTNIKEDQSFFLTFEKIQQGKTYYLKSYFIQKGVTTYSTEEVVFIHNFTNNWLRFPSPELESNEFISPANVTYSGFRGGIVYYKVDKTTNLAKESLFYPNFNEWDPRFFQRETIPLPMRFNPFVATFKVTSTVEATMIGGGFFKKANTEKFFVKDIRIEGIDGYKWDPEYPGGDVVATGFGLENKAFALENKANGKLWKYESSTIKWDSVNVSPVNFDAKLVTFDIGERAFVLVESDDWSEKENALYEYSLPQNKWIKMTTFRGENRRRGIAFTLKGKLYYGAGQSAKTYKPLRDIWEFDPLTNTWKKVTDYPGAGTINLTAVGIGNFVYVGFGQQVTLNAINVEITRDMGDYWRFRPD
ncbi:MAG: hypothetical protein U5M51_11995 [Emticicia sp.]|nr:hypothetical protein [Emticicia sp.]